MENGVRSMRPRLKMKTVALLITSVVVTISMMLYWFQTSLIFPSPNTENFAWDATEFHATDHWIEAADGTKINAWVFEHDSPKATLIYSHGNAESICFLGDFMVTLRDLLQVNVVVFDYRGYGRTAGAPSEAGLEKDAVAVGMWVKNSSSLNNVPIIAYGRSMGGFTANVMASKLQLDGLILERTFSSVADVGSHKFPFVPVHWLLKHRMRSDRWIQSYKGPLLQIHGLNDEVIPFVLAKKLFEGCPSSDKHFIEVERLTHNHPLPKFFFHEVERFIDHIHQQKLQSPTSDPKLEAMQTPPTLSGNTQV